ncbi:hypothetical protein HDV03_000336 [Kappamyces sp. JEL0829]|nr:hypothetical protein HDV03_000336 [Kappamyces sp. JEL0829]
MRVSKVLDEPSAASCPPLFFIWISAQKQPGHGSLGLVSCPRTGLQIAANVAFSRHLLEDECEINQSLHDYFLAPLDLELRSIDSERAETVAFELLSGPRDVIAGCAVFSMLMNGWTVVTGATYRLPYLDHEFQLRCREQTPSVVGRVDFKTKIEVNVPDVWTCVPNPVLPDTITQVPVFHSVAQDLLQRLEIFVAMRTLDTSSPCCRGHLVLGSRGCGKTHVVKKVVEAFGMDHLYLRCSELVSHEEGGTERMVSKILSTGRPILILDDFDTLLAAGGSKVAALFVDEFLNPKRFLFVVAVASTDSIERHEVPSGIFTSCRQIDLPGMSGRLALLQSFLHNATAQEDERSAGLEAIAAATQGFTVADLLGVVRMAILKSVDGVVTMTSVLELCRASHPSNLTGLVSKQIPDTALDELYGIDPIIRLVSDNIIEPLRNPMKLEAVGIAPPKGFLIHGPPGAGKTALACATINATGLSCIYVQSTTVRSKIVGQAERTIAKLFSQARSASPCIMLIDQLEALVSRRGADTSSEGSGDRITTSFLTEMDGIFSKGSLSRVFIVAVTNDIRSIDPAVLRAGRLDIHVKVPKPDQDSRTEILTRTLAKMPHDLTSEQLSLLALRTDGASSGDLVNLCREAAMAAIRSNQTKVTLTLTPLAAM